MTTTDDFYAEMRERQATTTPHTTERVKVCKSCGAECYGGMRDLKMVRGYERGDGMWIEEYATVCCGGRAPFHNGHTPQHWKWIARTVADESELTNG